ncbi:type III pantothenate kinase [Campylobacter suis]|uniref:Type III pantothenate kinase n=1 Tax=Campylobacter suis TaxID=2790657 RepID=A0ABM8Q6Y5_9BACT|nr:type III pantothenate kinase [Campylobacter suis]CAD7288557.1 Type III pantothenate kinase [Campylobacter suis]
MKLCDIGNTNATFYENGKITRVKIENFSTDSNQPVYFISVNDSLKERLKNAKNFIDLEPYFELDTIYQGIGIDRIAACYGIKDGVVVDAGSAITVDIMANSIHLGGYILPGIAATLKAFEEISPRLKVVLNSQIELEAFPQKTADAVSYGIIKPIITLISAIAYDKSVYLTGGDGEFLARFFKNGICDKTLVFRSMQRLINEKGLHK